LLVVTYHKIIFLKNKTYRKFFTGLIDWKLLTPSLHLIIVNQQIFITKNITWTMLMSTYKQMFFCYIKFKDYYLQSSIFKLKILE